VLRLTKSGHIAHLPAIFSCILFLASAANSLAQNIYTVVGGYVGDGGPATSASFAYPVFAAFDQAGNLYVSDEGHCRIRKVDTGGSISTVAGTGICGYSGNGGAATKAKLNRPTGVAIDAAGDVFFADYDRIREINTSGRITTIAGKGVDGYCGDGKSALKACFQLLEGIALSGTDLYIADAPDCRVRKISAGIVTTVAGNGMCQYSGDGGLATNASLTLPQSVAISGASGSQVLWILDEDIGGAVRRVDLSTGLISTYMGGVISPCGSNSFQSLCGPLGITLDAIGNLYIADTNDARVLQVQVPQSGTVVLEAGNQGEGFNGDGLLATNTMLNLPADVAVNNAGGIFTIDSTNDRIRSGVQSQQMTTVAGGFIGDGGQALQSSLNLGYGGAMSFDNNGNLYVADSADYRVRKVSPAGVITTLAGNGKTGYSGDGGLATAATLNYPSGVAADQNGNVFISDLANHAVRKVDSTGIITSFAGPFSHSLGLVTDPSGNLYVADGGTCVVWKVTPSGEMSIVAGVQNQCGYNSDGIPATQSWLFFPDALALDAMGNLYIADVENFRIRKVDSGGTISTVAGDGYPLCGNTGNGGPATAAPLCLPEGLAVDVAGNFYITDRSFIRVVNTSGIIEDLAGDGAASVGNGNALPALKTGVFTFAVTASPKGVVYFSDNFSYLVRKVQTKTASTLSSSQNPSTQGQPVTFTATVTGSTGTNPVGTVTFKVGTKSLGKQPLTGGKASITTTKLPQGANTITATFNGGTDFTKTSSSLVQTVN
jgi:sugar lactone lactonase YvrE